MRGLKQDRSASIVITGHAFVQNLRRGHYGLAVDGPVTRRVAVGIQRVGIDDLMPLEEGQASACRPLTRCNRALQHVGRKGAAIPPALRRPAGGETGDQAWDDLGHAA
jgi:hypothetical protein